MKLTACEWFALCAEQTTRESVHPILGPVPVCQRCADKLDLDTRERTDLSRHATGRSNR